MSFIVVTLTYLKLSGVNYSHGYFQLKIGVTKSNTPIKYIGNYIPPISFISNQLNKDKHDVVVKT